MTLLLVDNNPEPSLAPILEGWLGPRWISVVHRHVPQRGLSQARNEALRTASEIGDLAAFIDDDEVPDPGWLVHLLATRQSTGAPLINGPVVALYPDSVPTWIRRGRFFDLPAWGEGDFLEEGLSGNALLDLVAVADAGLRFDERYSASGGEDQVFFRMARAAGLVIRFSSRSTVSEEVPESRATFRYLSRREFRKGNTLGLLAVNHPELGEGRLYRSGAAAKWVLRGALRTASSPFLAGRSGQGVRATAARGLLEMSRACGMAVGLTGWRYELYQRGPS